MSDTPETLPCRQNVSAILQYKQVLAASLGAMHGTPARDGIRGTCRIQEGRMEFVVTVFLSLFMLRCAHCSSEFTRKSNLTRHIASYHATAAVPVDPDAGRSASALLAYAMQQLVGAGNGR